MRDASSTATVFVRNLPASTRESALESHFSSIGPVRRVFLVTERGGTLCRGFAFVTYAIASDAKTAIETLSGSLFQGRRLTIDKAKPRNRKDKDGKDGDGEQKEGNDEEEPEFGRRKRNPVVKDVKRVGAKKGSVAVRTVLVTRKDGSELTKSEALEALKVDKENDSGFQHCVVLQDTTARCTFLTWRQAANAAARAHGQDFDAVVEALHGKQTARVIVRNLPFFVDMNEMEKTFGGVARLREIVLSQPKSLKIKAKDKGDGDTKRLPCGGFAFVEYFAIADAKYAVQKLNSCAIGGRNVAVDIAVGKRQYEQARQQQNGDDDEVEEKDDVEVPDETKISEKDRDADPDVTDQPQEDGSESDDGDGDNSESEASDDGNKPETVPVKEATSTDEELSRTVFMRNVAYEARNDEVWRAMSHFGPVEQAVVVRDGTGRARGTAFVRFENADSARKACEAGAPAGADKVRGTSGPTLHGRMMTITAAVSRGKAVKLGVKEVEDKKNMRLAWIGVVQRDSKEAKGLSEAELQRRERAVKEKKTKLERNPNAFVSDVRLCIRNLPRDMDELGVKELVDGAAREETEGEKGGKGSGTGLKGKGGKAESGVVHVSIVRDEGRKGRSKGFGFVELRSHEGARRALGRLNNRRDATKWMGKKREFWEKEWKGRRLMVEFAVEDRRKVLVLEKIRERGRQLKEEARIKREQKEKEAKEGNSNKSKRAGKEERRAALKRKRGRVEQAQRPQKMQKGQKKGVNEAEKKTGKRAGERQEPLVEHQKAGQRESGKKKENTVEQKEWERQQGSKKRRKSDDTQSFDKLVSAYASKLNAQHARTKRTKKSNDNKGDATEDGVETRWFA